MADRPSACFRMIDLGRHSPLHRTHDYPFAQPSNVAPRLHRSSLHRMPHDRAQSQDQIPRGSLAGLTVLILVAFAIQASLGALKPGTLQTLGEDSGTSHRQVVQSQHQQAARPVRRQSIRPIAATLARQADRARTSLAPRSWVYLGAAPFTEHLPLMLLDLPPPARA